MLICSLFLYCSASLSPTNSINKLKNDERECKFLWKILSFFIFYPWLNLCNHQRNNLLVGLWFVLFKIFTRNLWGVKARPQNWKSAKNHQTKNATDLRFFTNRKLIMCFFFISASSLINPTTFNNLFVWCFFSAFGYLDFLFLHNDFQEGS